MFINSTHAIQPRGLQLTSAFDVQENFQEWWSGLESTVSDLRCFAVKLQPSVDAGKEVEEKRIDLRMWLVRTSFLAPSFLTLM